MSSDSEMDDDSYAYSEEDEYEMDNEDALTNPNAAPVVGLMRRATELQPEMDNMVANVVEVLGIPSTTALPLLHAFKWQKDALLEAFLADPKLLPSHGLQHHSQSSSQIVQESLTCPICYDDVTSVLKMPCGHAFCMDCWQDFAKAALSNGPSCTHTTCPDNTCPEVVTLDEFSQLLQPNDLKQLHTFHLRLFVEANPQARWCPGPGCQYVAFGANDEVVDATCHCGTIFCRSCGEEPHGPSTCPQLKLWLEKCRNESETANWILANTKSCPRCSSRIEKNQGCNHMNCQKCHYEFCWICLGDWSQHGANTGGYYKCNKYEGPPAESDAAQAKRDLDRYLHYYKRYHAHAQAQAFAQKQLAETDARMVALSSSETKWSDVEFLKHANEQLVECRRVLKYTYVFSYYMDSQARTRFEHHQEMLERFTENLSELSEKPLEEMDRTTVVNQTRVVDRFMRNILQYVADGME